MVHFRPCPCPPGKTMRIHRALWMRMFFPSRALFECVSCGEEFLASVAEQANMGLRAQAERLQSFHEEGKNESAAG